MRSLQKGPSSSYRPAAWAGMTSAGTVTLPVAARLVTYFR